MNRLLHNRSLKTNSKQRAANQGELLASFALLKIKLHGELYNARVVARRNDFSKIASGVQIADWIGEVNVVEEIEKFGAKFDVFCFVKSETLADGKISVELFGSAQDIAPDVAEIGADDSDSRTQGICESRAAGTWNDLPAS